MYKRKRACFYLDMSVIVSLLENYYYTETVNIAILFSQILLYSILDCICVAVYLFCTN